MRKEESEGARKAGGLGGARQDSSGAGRVGLAKAGRLGQCGGGGRKGGNERRD